MGCGCQGSSNVFKPPTEKQLASAALIRPGESRGRIQVWDAPAGDPQPPAQQKG